MAPESGIPAVPLDAEAMHTAGLAAAAALPPDTAEGTTPAVATPAGEPTEQAATAENADSFTRLDPNALPAELRPYYESMQADYTRKTQEIAPTRQLQSELGLDGEGLRQAAELYSALQDPNSLVEFYNELSNALQAQGLTPAQADAAATQHIQGTMQPGVDPELMDPEERRVAELEARLSKFEGERKAEIDARAREFQNIQLVQEMNRQESVVRESYPDWTQEDIDALYKFSGGNNLIEAAAQLADYTSAKVARILNGKGAVSSDPANTPLPPALAGVTRPQSFGSDLDAAHRAALEAAKLLP